MDQGTEWDGDRELLGTLAMMKLAGLRGFPHEETIEEPARCCTCRRVIRPRVQHRAWPVLRAGLPVVLRQHLRCPRLERMSASDWFLVAFGWTFGLAVLWVLFGALGYQW